MRIHTYRAFAASPDDGPEDAFSSCPCGILVSEGYWGREEAVVSCWRTGRQPSGIGIEVSATMRDGRSLAYAAAAEVACGWPSSEFHIYYTDGYEHLAGPE